MRVARLDIGDTYLIDEVKIGTAYADVVVSDPAIGLMGVAGAAIAFSRRRKTQLTTGHLADLNPDET